MRGVIWRGVSSGADGGDGKARGSARRKQPAPEERACCPRDHLTRRKLAGNVAQSATYSLLLFGITRRRAAAAVRSKQRTQSYGTHKSFVQQSFSH